MTSLKPDVAYQLYNCLATAMDGRLLSIWGQRDEQKSLNRGGVYNIDI